MARGRMIDKRITRSKKFPKLKGHSNRLLYLLVYIFGDIEGRVFGDPEEIKDECLPKLKFSLRQIAEGLLDMHQVGLVNLYAVDNIPYIEIVKFGEFQTLDTKREGKSKIPPNCYSRDTGLLHYCNTTALLSLSLSLSKLIKEDKKRIYFDYEAADWKNITQQDIDGWSQAYPACDIYIELFQMREWCLSNPDKKKSNWRRFITNWLSRTQERGGTKGIAKAQFSGIKKWYEEKLREEADARG